MEKLTVQDEQTVALFRGILNRITGPDDLPPPIGVRINPPDPKPIGACGIELAFASELAEVVKGQREVELLAA